jgi:hypothetical protein
VIRSTGKCSVDAVEIGEIQISILTNRESALPGPIMSAKYALSNAESGTRFGAGNRNQWSERTMNALAELISAMEEEVCEDLFEGHTSGSGGAVVADTTDGGPGL